MSEDHPTNEDSSAESKPGMEINLDRGRRLRGSLMFWCILLAAGGVLTVLLARFTGSKLIAIGLSAGMLIYMLIAGGLTSRSLNHSMDDGRLD
jgi:hypothetical protein